MAAPGRRVCRSQPARVGFSTARRAESALATTAVFAEILIIGLQVEAWLVLGLLTITGHEWIDVSGAKDFAALAAIVLLAAAYVLGIVADRLADTLVDRLERTGRGERLKRRLLKHPDFKKPADVSKMRLLVMHRSDGMSRFLDYQRSRWRIARATVLNVALAGVAGACYLAVRESWYWLFAPLAGALVLMPITYFAGTRIQEAWIERLSDAYRIVRVG